jgi:hypothetical protein
LTTKNPNGVWTFGWTADLAGTLHLYKDPFEKNGTNDWSDKAIFSLGDPCIACNPTDGMVSNVPPHSMYMHPGPQRQFSHCVFTATASGIYDVQATFTAIDIGGPKVYVLHNGSEIGSCRLKEQKPWPFSAESIEMDPGDTIEVVVGVGPDRVFMSDGTAFSLTITKH